MDSTAQKQLEAQLKIEFIKSSIDTAAIHTILDEAVKAGFDFKTQGKRLIEKAFLTKKPEVLTALLGRAKDSPVILEVVENGLLNASIQGEVEVVKYLTQSSEVPECYRQTITIENLNIAIEWGHLDLIDYLVQHNPELIAQLAANEAVSREAFYLVLTADKINCFKHILPLFSTTERAQALRFMDNAVLGMVAFHNSIKCLTFLLDEKNYLPGGLLEGVNPPQLGSAQEQHFLYEKACRHEDGYIALYLLQSKALDLSVEEAFSIAGKANNVNLVNHFLTTPEYGNSFHTNQLVPKLFIHACSKGYFHMVELLHKCKEIDLSQYPEVLEFLATQDFPKKEQILIDLEKSLLETNISSTLPNKSSLADKFKI